MLNEKQEVIGSLPLTLDENRLVYLIFKKRAKLVLTVILTMTAWILFANFRSEVATEDVLELNRFQIILIRMGFLFFLVYGIFTVHFFKRVYPFYRDYKHNQKDVINYTITMKRYFPYNNQYFIGLDHPDYLFHQISEQEWIQLHVDNTYPLFRAHFSKYVFNSQGRYLII